MTDQKMFAIVKGGKIVSDVYHNKDCVWQEFNFSWPVHIAEDKEFARIMKRDGYKLEPITVSLDSKRDCRNCVNWEPCNVRPFPSCISGDKFKPSDKIQLYKR